MTKILTVDQREKLIKTLKLRFMENMIRHKGFDWEIVLKRLEKYPERLWTLNEMEITGGEPDVVDYNNETDEFIFYDCSPETPLKRRNLCYDRAALESRKTFKPKDNAQDVANLMGIEILNEDQYRNLQKIGEFDLKTSSWLKTPDKIRNLGGALFADRRYDTVFIYHNGAESYYAGRGFRGVLIV